MEEIRETSFDALPTEEVALVKDILKEIQEERNLQKQVLEENVSSPRWSKDPRGSGSGSGNVSLHDESNSIVLQDDNDKKNKDPTEDGQEKEAEMNSDSFDLLDVNSFFDPSLDLLGFAKTVLLFSIVSYIVSTFGVPLYMSYFPYKGLRIVVFFIGGLIFALLHAFMMSKNAS